MSSYGRRRRCGKKGFSLLEILIVLAIIGIIARVAALGFGAAKDPLQEEVKHLYDQMQLAREDAVLQDRQFGMEALEEEDGRYRYRWLEYNSGRGLWLNSGRSVLKARRLPPGVRLELSVEDEPIELSESEREELEEREEQRERGKRSDIDDGWPQVFFLSSGEVTPFRLWLRRDHEDGSEAEVLLEGDMIGRIKIRRDEQ